MELQSKSTEVTQNVMQVLNETSLSSLPLEVLEHIFSFLNRDDLLQAMSVCTTWESLIFSSPNLWRSQTFFFDCALHVKKKEKVDMLFCTQNFGPHFQTLSVRCRHSYVPNCDCKKMAQQFHLFLTGFKSPELTSFKVYDLQLLQWFCLNKIVTKQISRKLIEMLSSGCRLKVFKMPESRFRVTDGRDVLDTVFQNSKNTLETLNIAEFFYILREFPACNWLTTGLTSLKKLTKLSISMFYLNDELIVSLARARRGQLSYLSLTANFEFRIFPIEQDSWKCLLKECPNIKVSFKILGRVLRPHLSFAAVLDSILPVTKLKIVLHHSSYSRDVPSNEMEIVLEHVRTHYGPWLKSFTLVMKNKKEETFDQSLLNLVRDCPHLELVKTLVSFYTEDTVKTINKIVAKRRQPHLTDINLRNTEINTNSLVEEKASELEDHIDQSSGLHEASQQ